jgi:hypothetical protein
VSARRCAWPECPCRALAGYALCVLDLGTLLGALPGDPADDGVEVYDDAACEPLDGAA